MMMMHKFMMMVMVVMTMVMVMVMMMMNRVSSRVNAYNHSDEHARRNNLGVPGRPGALGCSIS